MPRIALAGMAVATLLAGCVPVGEDPGAALPSATTLQTGVAASPVPGAAPVEAAVVKYLKDDANRDYRSMARDTAGSISALWTWYDADYGSCTCPKEGLTIDSVHATRVEGNRATVALSAALQAPDHITWFSGPMHLRRIRGRWRILDYRRNGSPLAGQIHPTPNAHSVAAGDVTFRILGTWEDRDGVGLWLDTRNQGTTSIRITNVSLATLDGGFVNRRLYTEGNALRTDAGNHTVRLIDLQNPRGRRLGGPCRLRIVFQDQYSGATFTIIAANR
jgi:hypothetical protein